jgi:[acyl-carrier-protein] S-malonyltransferase
MTLGPAQSYFSHIPRLCLADGPVYLFPGQGSQVPGMRERVLAYCPALLDIAESMVGQRLLDGEDGSTRLLQPAIYCASVAGWLRAREVLADDSPAAFAGHSLGEVTALAAAGAMSFEDGVRLVVERGVLMERAAAAGRAGGMLATLGADAEFVASLALRLGLTLATDNAPGEMVLAGDLQALREAGAEVTGAGAKAVLLPIQGAFHSAAMESITGPFERAVRIIRPVRPQVPVFSGLTSRPFADIAAGLAASLTGPVRWRQTLAELRACGARRFVDTGPGHVLAGLVRRTLPGVTALAVDEADGAWPEQWAHPSREKAARS